MYICRERERERHIMCILEHGVRSVATVAHPLQSL